MGELLGKNPANVSLYPDLSIRLGGYTSGNYGELFKIKKNLDINYNSITILIANSFFGAQHGGNAILSFIVSSKIVPFLLTNRYVGGLEFYSYDDGTYMHVYVATNGGNGMGTFYTTILQKAGGVSIDFTGIQLEAIPTDSIKIN